MKTFSLETGKNEIEFLLDEEYFAYEVVNPKVSYSKHPMDRIISDAFDNPIESLTLENLVRGKQNVAVIICDNTRYLPQKELLDVTLSKLNDAGVKKHQIKIIIATGTHADMTDGEIVTMLGQDIFDGYEVINHDAFDKDKLVYLGESKQNKVPIYLNKYVAEADFRIGIGTVDPHIFAGYSGGNKILSVGVAGEQSISQTHNPKMMEDANTKFGDIKNNTFRNYINEVASIVKVDFLINVVQNSKKQLIAAFTGDAIKAYERAVQVAKGLYEVRVNKKADIVITMPKKPKTLNLYQAIRSVNSVIFFNEPIVKEGGTVILPAECDKGIGSDDFYTELKNSKSPEAYIEHARIHGFSAEGNKAFTVAKMLKHAKVVVTNTKIDKKKLNDMHIDYAEDVNKAVENLKEKGRKKHIIILTDGFLTLPVYEA